VLVLCRAITITSLVCYIESDDIGSARSTARAEKHCICAWRLEFLGWKSMLRELALPAARWKRADLPIGCVSSEERTVRAVCTDMQYDMAQRSPTVRQQSLLHDRTFDYVCIGHGTMAETPGTSPHFTLESHKYFAAI